jgi:hypothetical protein
MLKVFIILICYGMINFIIKILFIFSLWFNVALYFDWIDIWQYREYVDKGIQIWQEIGESEELANLWNLFKTKLEENFGEDFDNMLGEAESLIKKRWTDYAQKVLKSKYSNFSSGDINNLIEYAGSEMLKSSLEESLSWDVKTDK